MAATDKCIKKVKALIEVELQLLKLSLFIADKGSAVFNGHELKCTLTDKVKSVVVPMSLAGGQSVTTILDSSTKRGIPVRDCFPVARCAVETLINAGYVLVSGEQLADRAIRHAQQKSFREMDRTYGHGDFKFRIRATEIPDLEQNAELKSALDEFTSKQGKEKNWTNDSVPMRIEKIGHALGVGPASKFLGAYSLVYSDSSEIIHGSLFGIHKFYHGDSEPPTNVDEFRSLTARHIEGILFAVFLALNGYLRTYCLVQKLSTIDDLLKAHFDRFMDTIRTPPTKKG
jgi:hypothetical protein